MFGSSRVELILPPELIRVLRVSMFNLLIFFCLDFVLWPLSGFYVYLDFEMPLVFAFVFSD